MARSDEPYISVVLVGGTVKVSSVSSFDPFASIDGSGNTTRGKKPGPTPLTAIFAHQATDGTNYVIYIPEG